MWLSNIWYKSLEFHWVLLSQSGSRLCQTSGCPRTIWLFSCANFITVSALVNSNLFFSGWTMLNFRSFSVLRLENYSSWDLYRGSVSSLAWTAAPIASLCLAVNSLSGLVSDNFFVCKKLHELNRRARIIDRIILFICF